MVVPLLSDEQYRLLGVGLGTAPGLYVFFIAGVVYKRQLLAIAEATPPIAWLALWVAFIAVSAVVWGAGLMTAPLVPTTMRAFGCLAGIGAGVLLSRAAPVVFLGTRSLQVYVTHMPVIAFALVALCAAGIYVESPALVAALVVSLSAATLAIVLFVPARFGAGALRYMYDCPDWFRATRPLASWSRSRRV